MPSTASCPPLDRRRPGILGSRPGGQAFRRGAGLPHGRPSPPAPRRRPFRPRPPQPPRPHGQLTGPPPHHPRRQLRLVHLQPGAPDRRGRRPRRGRPQRRGFRRGGRLCRRGRRRDLPGPVRPGRGRDQRRRGSRMRRHDPAARHLPGPPGHRRGLRRADRQGAPPRPRPGLAGQPRRPRCLRRPAAVVGGDPVPLANRRRGIAAARTGDNSKKRDAPDGPAARPPPGRGRPVPPGIHPHRAWPGAHPQLRPKLCPNGGWRLPRARPG